jgi:hypothetical protein
MAFTANAPPMRGSPSAQVFRKLPGLLTPRAPVPTVSISSKRCAETEIAGKNQIGVDLLSRMCLPSCDDRSLPETEDGCNRSSNGGEGRSACNDREPGYRRVIQRGVYASNMVSDVGKYLSEAAASIFSPTASDVDWQTSSFSGRYEPIRGIIFVFIAREVYDMQAGHLVRLCHSRIESGPFQLELAMDANK